METFTQELAGIYPHTYRRIHSCYIREIYPRVPSRGKVLRFKSWLQEQGTESHFLNSAAISEQGKANCTKIKHTIIKHLPFMAQSMQLFFFNFFMAEILMFNFSVLRKKTVPSKSWGTKTEGAQRGTKRWEFNK